MTVYRKKRSDPKFAEQWGNAVQRAVGLLHARAWNSAVKGNLQAVYQDGQVVGYTTVYDSRLTELLLRAHMPELFGGSGVKRKVAVGPETKIASPEEVLETVRRVSSLLARPQG